MAGFDRSRISLGRRTQQQTDTREQSSGTARKSFMNWEGNKLKFFKFGEPGTYHDINILPWRISSKNHPEVVAGRAKVGDYDYVMDVWVHNRIGPDQVDCICPKKTYGKACPICDEANAIASSSGNDAARALFARRRCVYLIQELDEDLHAKGKDPMIFEVSHGNFSKELQEQATSCLRGKGIVDFADPDNGKVVSFRVSEETMGNGKTYKKAASIGFNNRVEEITDELLESCPSLDAYLDTKTSDQLKAILFGDGNAEDSGTEDEPEEEAPAERPARSREPEPEEETPRRRESREPAEAPREAPARTRSREPEPEEEAPAEPAPRRRQAPASECPNNYEFGADCDSKALCYKCPDAIYNKCKAAHDR